MKLETYYHRRITLGMSSHEASYHRDLDAQRLSVRRAVRRYRLRWGRPDRNPSDRMLWEIGRELGLKSREAVRQYLKEIKL